MEDQTVLVEFISRKAVTIHEDMKMSDLFKHLDETGNARQIYVVALFGSDPAGEDIVTYRTIRQDPISGKFGWYPFRTPCFMQDLCRKWALAHLDQKYPPIIGFNPETAPLIVERVG